MLPTQVPANVPSGIQLEYPMLRQEIIARISIRHQLFVVTLAAIGFLAADTTGSAAVGELLDIPGQSTICSAKIALLFPVLAAFLGWARWHNDERIHSLADYIRVELEGRMPGAKWESWLAGQRSEEFLVSLYRPMYYVLLLATDVLAFALMGDCRARADLGFLGVWFSRGMLVVTIPNVIALGVLLVILCKVIAGDRTYQQVYRRIKTVGKDAWNRLFSRRRQVATEP